MEHNKVSQKFTKFQSCQLSPFGHRAGLSIRASPRFNNLPKESIRELGEGKVVFPTFPKNLSNIH